MTYRCDSGGPGPRSSRAGFTMIEVMLAIVITAVVVTGIIGLYKIEVTASSYSRHSTEAAALAEDKLEKLRTLGTASSTCPSASCGIDSNIGPEGLGTTGIYTRMWNEFLCQGPLSAPPAGITSNGTAASTAPCTVSAAPSVAEEVVTVNWVDDGIAHTLTVFGRRGLQ
jgi:prepilin-type N-terminal cleavage/methylation domain-containing protein